MDIELKSSPPPNLIKGIMVFPTLFILSITVMNYKGKTSILIALSGLLLLYIFLKISINYISKRWIYFKVLNSVLYVKNKDQTWIPLHELKQHVSVELKGRSICILYDKYPERHFFEEDQFKTLLEYFNK